MICTREGYLRIGCLLLTHFVLPPKAALDHPGLLVALSRGLTSTTPFVTSSRHETPAAMVGVSRSTFPLYIFLADVVCMMMQIIIKPLYLVINLL